MNNGIIEKFKKCVVQIATPYSSGTGFILFSEGVVVTNYHVVKNCDEVVINGREFKKTKAKVLFIDPHFDIAFLQSPVPVSDDGPVLSDSAVLEGESVLAIGHPLGLKYTSTGGIVSKTERDYNGIKYFQIDAAINPGNSGGPLINSKGEIIGVNTFIIKDAESLAFSLPHFYVKECLESYQRYSGKSAVRCRSCRKTQLKEDLSSGFCANCGFRFDKDDILTQPFVAEGIIAKIENIITRCGYDAGLSRSGPMFWEISSEAAFIKITYVQATKFTIFDAPVCYVPEEKISEFFEFVLKENFELKNVVFSLKNNELYLSVITFEDDFDEDAGFVKLKELIGSASGYRKNLEYKYNAKPIQDIVE
jgi:serine protease Do